MHMVSGKPMLSVNKTLDVSPQRHVVASFSILSCSPCTHYYRRKFN